MPYDRDILVRLIVKKEKAAFDYQSVRNSQTDFPVLTCAAAKTEAGYRFSIGARPGKAVLLNLQTRIFKPQMWKTWQKMRRNV